MSVVEKVHVDIAVVLGNAIMPVHQILRMGRGAVIELDSYEEDDLTIMANNKPIARGQVLIQGDKIAIKVTEFIKKPLVERATPEQMQSGAQRADAAIPDIAEEESFFNDEEGA